MLDRRPTPMPLLTALPGVGSRMPVAAAAILPGT